jgi:hypothetical protein
VCGEKPVPVPFSPPQIPFRKVLVIELDLSGDRPASNHTKIRFFRLVLFMWYRYKHHALGNMRKLATKLTVLDTILRIITHLSEHAECRLSFSLQT